MSRSGKKLRQCVPALFLISMSKSSWGTQTGPSARPPQGRLGEIAPFPGPSSDTGLMSRPGCRLLLAPPLPTSLTQILSSAPAHSHPHHHLPSKLLSPDLQDACLPLARRNPRTRHPPPPPRKKPIAESLGFVFCVFVFFFFLIWGGVVYRARKAGGGKARI